MLKKIITCCGLLMIPLSSYAHDLSELIRLVEPINSLKAKFTQVVKSDEGATLDKSSGEMAIQKPNLFSWHVKTPDPVLIVMDGEKIYNYDESLEQVTIQRQDEAVQNTPLAILLGEPYKISELFEVDSRSTSPCGGDVDSCFMLVPKSENSAFLRVIVGFTDENLKELTVVDQLGQISMFEFNILSKNQEISDRLFKFSIPKGVDVIELDKE